MHRYAAGFTAGALFLAATELAVFMRAIHGAISGDEEEELPEGVTP